MDWTLIAQAVSADVANADAALDIAAESDRIESLWHALTSPSGFAIVAAALLTSGIYLLLPPRGQGKKFIYGAGLTSLAVLLFLWPTLVKLPAAPAFFLLEGLAILGGLGTVTSRSPVYCAIWFASSLLSIGALMLMAGAQFLGLATVAVYAGAIVVTFLFVLMLAQPEGHAVYDRVGWGWLPALCASIAGASVVAMVVGTLLTADQASGETSTSQFRTRIVAAIDLIGDDDLIDVRSTFEARSTQGPPTPLLRVTLRPESGLLENGSAVVAAEIREVLGDDLDPATRIDIGEHDVLSENHVARLGGALFGRHLISIQVAAILLLLALVGAIAMAIHGKEFASANVSRSSSLDGKRKATLR